MKDLKLRDKVRTLLYMIGMVAVLFMAETTIAYATSDDDALSNSILSEQPVDENRTNIREPGSSENADDLKQLNLLKKNDDYMTGYLSAMLMNNNSKKHR